MQNLLLKKTFPKTIYVEWDPNQWIDSELDRWRAETRFVSSATTIESHSAIQFLAQLASENSINKELILKRLLLRMTEQPARIWIWGIQLLTENILELPENTPFDSQVSAWVQWGKDKGYL